MAEEQEEKEGTDWAEIFGHAVRFMILCWSLAMMTLGYMDKIRNDGVVFSRSNEWGLRQLRYLC